MRFKGGPRGGVKGVAYSSPGGAALLAVDAAGELPGEQVAEGGQHGLHRLGQGCQHQRTRVRAHAQRGHQRVGGRVDGRKQRRVQRRAQLVVPFLCVRSATDGS